MPLPSLRRASLPRLLTLTLTALVAGASAAHAAVDPAADLRDGLRSRLRTLQATTATSPTPEAALEQARVLHRLALLTEETGEKRALLERGSRLLSSLKDADPPNPAAILWWTALEGSLAEMNKDLRALATIRDLERVLLRLRRADPAFGAGAADRALGILYWKAPPLISIGSTQKANSYLRAAATRFPGHAENEVSLAEFLLGRGEKDEARTYARRALTSAASSTAAPGPNVEARARNFEAHALADRARHVLERTGG